MNESLSYLLVGSGFSVIKLHRTWLKACAGNKHCIATLEALLLKHPKVAGLLDSFAQGQVITANPKHQFAPTTTREVSSLGRIAVGSKPVSGGLPSLGKRR